ncbi:MAG: lipase, partial [Bacteroidota bacterium]
YGLLRKGKKTGFGCDCPKEEKLFTFAMATEDYLDATKFVIENQELIQVDTTKIIAGGSSAGAEGVLNAVFMKDYFLDDTSAYDDIKFAGLFSLAGAMVNSDFIKKENALPTILFHGSKDNLVPYAISAHHQCEPNRKGYIILHGTEAISKKLDDLGKSYYFHKAIGAGHELSSIPFGQLDTVLEFINKTIINKEIIQTKKTVFK